MGEPDPVSSAESSKEDFRRAVEALQPLAQLGLLTASVAHDFNCVLSVIRGCASLLRGSVPAGGAEEKDLAAILDAVRLGANLTAGLTAAAKGAGPDGAGDLGGAVEEARRLLGRLLGSIKLETRVAPSLPAVALGSPSLLRVLLNLAVNARDAMPDGGVLTISAEPAQEREGWTALRVVDTGKGLTPEARERLFEPFFTTKPAGKGCGLGLSGVRFLVESVGGSISLDDREGGGTAVLVELPPARR